MKKVLIFLNFLILITGCGKAIENKDTNISNKNKQEVMNKKKMISSLLLLK